MKKVFQPKVQKVSYKKFLSFIFLIFFSFISVITFCQTTVFQFDFESTTNVTIDNAVGTPNVGSSGVTPFVYNSTTYSCSGTYSYVANNWNAGDYIQFTVNTTGYSNLTFSYCDRVTGDNFNNVSVRVSPDGTNWTTVLNAYSPDRFNVVDRTTGTFPASCENVATVYIRIYKDNNPFTNRYLTIDNATLISTPPTIDLSSPNPAIGATNIYQGGTDQVLYYFTTDITGGDATINALSFLTSGTYAAADISLFRLLYNTSYDFYTASQIGSDITTSLGTGSHLFSGLNQSTAAGTTGHFWIVANVATAATSDNTISVDALTTGDLTYTSGTVTGTAYAGGSQTITFVVDSDGDGVGDLFDYDDDNDGITDDVENQPCNTSPAELFTNGDFEAGNTGFTSDYTYAPGLSPAGYPEGIYTITVNPHDWHDHFSDCGTSQGNIMIINASPLENAVIWSSGSIAITQNTTYTFSLKLASVHPANPADLIFRINGVELGAIFSASTTTCVWNNVEVNWNSGNLTSTTFEIINKNVIANGNDFALDDISCTYLVDCDTDGDGVVDILDRDSDNDGIYDIYEAGGTDSDNNGIIDNTTDADNDGLADIIDDKNSGHGATEVQSGTPLLSPDTDSDGIVDRIDTDSDDDLCTDAREAGFTDGDDDGELGSSPVTVDSWGVVTSASGYTDPADVDGSGTDDFLQQGPVIATQPSNRNICLLSSSNTSFVVAGTNPGGSVQWEVSTDGGLNWTDVTNGGIYGGATTNTLTLTGLTTAYDNFQYRLRHENTAYVCSPLYSNEATLRVHADLPATPGSITGLSESCPAYSSSYSILDVPNTVTYNWSVPVNWTIDNGAGTASIDVTAGSVGDNGNIAVTATNSCGTSAASTLPVTVAYPAPTFVVEPVADVCQNIDTVYTTESGKTNYVWTFSGTQDTDYTIVTGGTATDNTVTVRWLTTGSKTVTVNYDAGGCTGPTPTSTTTNVLPGPSVDIGPAMAAVCQGGTTAALGGSFGGEATSALWSDGGAGGTFTNNDGSTPGTTTYTASASSGSPVNLTLTTAGGACGSVSDNKSLVVNPSQPVSVTITGDNNPVCEGTTVNFTATPVNEGSGPLYQWLVNGANVGTGGTTYSYAPTDGDTLNVRLTSNATCATGNPALSNTITMTVNANPTPAITGDADVCEGCTYTYSTTATGNTFNWTVTGGTIDVDNGNEITVTWNMITPAGTLSAAGSVSVDETNSSTTCQDSDILNITIHRVPETGPAYHIDENTY